jgi:hypothetical protein
LDLAEALQYGISGIAVAFASTPISVNCAFEFRADGLTSWGKTQLAKFSTAGFDVSRGKSHDVFMMAG